MNLPEGPSMAPDDYDALLAQQDWKSLTKRLTEFVWRKMGRTSWEDAEDIAGAALGQLFDPRYQRWNPKTQPNIFWHLGSLANGVLSNARKKRLRNLVDLHEHEEIEEMGAEGVDATDEVLARRERARAIVQELGRQVQNDKACAGVLAAYTRETDDPRAQAEQTGIALQAVYNARSKLRALAAQIAHTFDQGTLQ